MQVLDIYNQFFLLTLCLSSTYLFLNFITIVVLFNFLFSLFKKFLLEYSCFTMLCQFLLNSKVNQLYVYIYPLFFGFLSHLGHHRALSRVPCAIQQVLISYLFIHSGVYMSVPISQFIPPPPSPLGIHTFVLYICVSISVLHIFQTFDFLSAQCFCGLISRGFNKVDSLATYRHLLCQTLLGEAQKVVS